MTMHTYLIDMLQCPACRGELAWKIGARTQERVEEAEAACLACGATYPVREGIGVFLTPDLPRNDYWEASGSSLLKFLNEHPEIEERLMGAPIESLNPTDQFYRAGVLDLTGRYAEARNLENLAHAGLYAPEQRAATARHFDAIIRMLTAHVGPIVDLASGRGKLAHFLLEHLPNSIVMTDFSPRVLRENRKRLMALGLYDRVDLLAFDARRTPFKDGAVPVMTTYAGLGNIEQPGNLLRELRRAVSGSLLAVSIFCMEDDVVHGEMLRQAGMEQMYFRRLALENFAAAGWEVEAIDATRTRVAPTPKSDLIPGATVDGFPVAETEMEFCLLAAQ